MKLENQVVSLELARKLKELGVKQESCFYWVSFEDYPDVVSLWSNAAEPSDIHAAAFTGAELGAMLPDELYDEEDGGWDNLCTYPNGSHWCCAYRRYYQEDGTWGTTYVELARSEANARAKMLIYLIENNLA